MSRSFIGRLLLDVARSWRKSPSLEPVADDELGPKFISLKVFHCPQLGHLPIHFVDSCPQLLQTYAVLVFAMMNVFDCKVT